MFTKARVSVLLAGYAVYNGDRVFQALANRMNEIQGLRVQCMLDIQRSFGDQTLADVLIKRFVANFKSQNWPEGARLPEIYYDPRSLELLPNRKASLHAKCVVIDGSEAFVSSANFTEAAQEKNIEVGVLLKSPAVASKLTTYFEGLIGVGLLRRVC
jgi:phosphatidylserine/phosphatidylglycerophosphate/cardiolipin synthase-like enzyme